MDGDTNEIVSFPGPDRSVTLEGLRTFHVTNRHYRNRRIGEFLKEIHLTEGRNTGFRKILRALESNGSPKPEFETDEDHSYFITRLYRHPAFAKRLHIAALDEASGDKSGDNSGDKSGDKHKISDKVEGHYLMVLSALAEEGLLQTNDIAVRLGIKAPRRDLVQGTDQCSILVH